jgi:hypothetical protein
MAYVDWGIVAKSVFRTWCEVQYDWCMEVKFDMSIVSQLYRHYWEQLHLLDLFTFEDILCQDRKNIMRLLDLMP